MIRLFSLAFSLLSFSLVSAQSDAVIEALSKTPSIEITTSSLLLEDGIRTTQSAEVIGETDDFAKAWRKFAKAAYGLDGRRENGLTICNPVLQPSLHADSIQVFYKIEKDGKFSRLSVLAKTKGQFITTNDSLGINARIKNMMEKGIHQFYIALYDEKIKTLQRDFDRQTRDVSKAEKQRERFQKEKTSNEKKLAITTDRMNSTRGRLDQIQNQKKALQTELELDKKEAEQSKEELEELEGQLATEESEYNAKYMSGEWSEKKAERERNDLIKLRERIDKQKGIVIKKNERVTARENKILQVDRNYSQTMTSIESMESEIDRRRSDNDQLTKEISNSENVIKEEQTQVESAKAALDRLKSAKEGLGNMK